MYVLYNIHIKRPKFQGRPKLWLWYSTFLRPRGHQSANPSPWFVPSWGIAPASAADGGNYPILMGKFDNNTLKHPKPHGKPMSEWSIFRMIWWVPCFRKHPHELEEFARRSCWKFTTGWFLSHKLFIILFTFGCLHWQLWPAVLSTNAALVSTNFTYENVHQLGNYSYSWVFCIYIYIIHTWLYIYIYIYMCIENLLDCTTETLLQVWNLYTRGVRGVCELWLFSVSLVWWHGRHTAGMAPGQLSQTRSH